MNNETKTMEQIYRALYSDELFQTNPLFIIEAIGYLNALLQFMPAESWAKTEKTCLLITVKNLAKEGVFKC